MRVWTQPLWPRVRAWVREHRCGLREAETLLLAAYFTYIIGSWVFGTDGAR